MTGKMRREEMKGGLQAPPWYHYLKRCSDQFTDGGLFWTNHWQKNEAWPFTLICVQCLAATPSLTALAVAIWPFLARRCCGQWPFKMLNEAGFIIIFLNRLSLWRNSSQGKALPHLFLLAFAQGLFPRAVFYQIKAPFYIFGSYEFS